MLKKTILVLTGLIFGLVFAELILQSASLFIKTVKSYEISKKLNDKNSISILCVGESTTDGQWPKFLKQSLIEKNIEKEIIIADKGVKATNTACISGNIESQIKELNPDIVVAMMGINDGNSDVIRLNKKQFKLQKLFFLIKRHFYSRKDVNNVKNIDEFLLNFNFASRLFDMQKYDESINIFESLLNQNKDKDIKIIKLLTRAYVIKAKNAGFETKEGQKYLNRAEQLVIKGIEIKPYYDINAILFVFAKNKNRFMIEKLFPVADKQFFKGLYEQDPWAFISHTHLFVELGMNEFVKTIAELLYSADIKENTAYSDRVFGSNATLLIESKNYSAAEIYLNKTRNYLMKNIPEMTIENYRKLAAICRDKNIKLIAMQYPMRPVEQLKIILEDYPEVCFVDNENIFKEALKTMEVSEIFKDLFAGDFGHCTDFGNRIIADNLANSIKKLYGDLK